MSEYTTTTTYAEKEIDDNFTLIDDTLFFTDNDRFAGIKEVYKNLVNAYESKKDSLPPFKNIEVMHEEYLFNYGCGYTYIYYYTPGMSFEEFKATAIG